MSGIIMPGQEHMDPRQIAEIERKQKMLTTLRKWEAFVNADTKEDIFETEIATEMQANVGRFMEAFPEADVSEEDKAGMVLKLHSGARMLVNEQMAMKQAVEAQGGNIPEEAILMTVAQVVTLVEGIALHDPRITSQPMFRAFALAIELGFIKTAPERPAEEETNTPEDVVED